MALNNSGVVNIPNSSVFLYGGGTITGTISCGSFSSIYCSPVPPAVTLLDRASLVGSSFNGSVTLAHTSTAEFANFSQISGDGELLISRTLSLTPVSGASTIASLGRVTVLPTATMNIAGSLPVVIDHATATNYGTAIFLVPSGSNTLKLVNGGIFDNRGTLTNTPSNHNPNSITSDSNTANAFINSDLMLLTANFFSVTMAAPFYNSGTVSMFLGPYPGFPFSKMTISGGGSASGLFTATGSLAITFSAPYTLSDANLQGSIDNTAPLTLIGQVHAWNFTVGAPLQGPGTLSGGGNRWSASVIGNSGGIITNSTEQSDIYHISDTIASLSTHFAILAGSTSPKTLDGTSIHILPEHSAAWGNPLYGFYASDQMFFQNGAQIHNDGAFYTYIGSPTFANADNHTANAFINTGTFGRSSLTLSSSPNITTMAIPFHNSGLVDIQQGLIDFAGGYFNDTPITSNTAAFHFAKNTGLYFSGGTYDFGDDPFDLGPGGLYGTGTVHGRFVSAGTISPGNSPGNSPGTLILDGDLALTPDASTILDILYTPTATQTDLLAIHGNFTANGTLLLTLSAPPTTPDATSYTLINSDTFLGTFLNAPDGTRLFDTANQGSFLITYTPTGLTLSDFQPLPEPSSLFLLLPTLLPLLRRRRRLIAHPSLLITF